MDHEKQEVDMKWIPKENQRITARQHSQKQQYGKKKKKSRRTGKKRSRGGQHEDKKDDSDCRSHYAAKTGGARLQSKSQLTQNNGDSRKRTNDAARSKRAATSLQGYRPPQHVDVKKDQALQNELKKIGGNFHVVCKKCFEGRPVKISPPDPANPTYCSYNNHLLMHNKCLVHRMGRGRFNKIRDRPSMMMRMPRPASICWYFDKPSGCERGDSCYFAHSEAEAKLWWLESRLGKRRPEVTEACVNLNHPASHVAAPPIVVKPRSEALSCKQQATCKWSTDSSHYKGNMVSSRQPASASRAVAVDSCPIKVPFHHTIKNACARCLSLNPRQIQGQNPKRPSYCTGGSRHSWGKHTTVYVLHSSQLKKWVRINPRPPRLSSNIHLVLCRKRKQCKLENAFGAPCMFPHCQEELELWEYQKQYQLTKLEEVVQLQQEAQDASAPPPKLAPQHTCSFCKFSCTSQTDFENHLLETAHKATIFLDSERLWKERDPPNLVQDGVYQMCKENATKQCDYSGSSKEENECIYAHSKDELDEWKQRHQYRLMKLRKAREMKLYSWLDNLVDENQQTSAEEAEDVITEEIFGIEMECSKEEEVTMELPATRLESDVVEDVIQWHVVVHCGEEKQLKRVGLLFDGHRPYFYLSEPENEYRPQTCPSGPIKRKDSYAYTVTVNFILSSSGCFKQWLIFDFGERPCLAKKLTVTVGSKSEVTHLEFKEQAVSMTDLWNESNSKIIKCMQPDQWSQRLEEQYPTPGSDRGQVLPGDVLSVNQDTYKEFMHCMLTDEERARMGMVAKYRTVTVMKISQHVKLEDSPFLVSQGGKLFGTIDLDKPLHDDSESSSVVQEFVETVFIRFHEQSDVVYEAERVRLQKGTVVVSLGPACVTERQLKGGQKVSVTIQFCISRKWFLSMHHAVESLSCMDTVLPKGQQPKRFPEVADMKCLEGLNSRQEQVARLVSSLGTKGERTSYSGPTMILGPFGTGKTHTLAKAIQRTLTERKGAKFLVCTHSNSAADLYIRDYLHEFCESRPDMWMLRVYAEMRKMSTIKETVKKYMLMDAAGPRLPTEEECKEWVSSRGPNILVVTLNTAVHLTKTATLIGYFTHIMIDEAAQALETEAIIPLALATEDTRVVLAGDPVQISPKVYSPRTLEAKFNMSLLQRLYKYDKQNDCHASCNLITNYRSCQPILDFLKVHYKTTFNSMSTCKEHPHLYPLNFVDVRGEEKLVGTSYMNAEEAKKIAEYVHSLINNWPVEEWGRPEQSEVVVLSPYRVQVDVIRGEMRKRHLEDVTVETVRNVQGKQYRAVFLSTVRTRSSLNKINITSLPQVAGQNVRNKFMYGFLSDKGLLNTALTRAQSLITVIGDPVALCSAGECQKTWQRYIKKCEKNRGIYGNRGLTVASIKNEIAIVEHHLNPNAKVFTPKASAARCAPRIPGTAKPAVSRAIEVKSCSQSTTRKQVSTEVYLSATGNRLSGANDEEGDNDNDDEDEELLVDDWLQELKIQVEEDEAEEYRRSHPEMFAEGQKEDDQEVNKDMANEYRRLHHEERGVSDQESEDQDAALDEEQQQENQSAKICAEPGGGLRSQMPQRRETISAGSKVQAASTGLASKSPNSFLKNLHMVERDGRYAVLHTQDDTYDSDDDDEDAKLDESGQRQQASVEELLHKAFQRPDVYKICVFHQNITGRMYAVPEDRQSGEEITISSMKRRGQALNSDKVLVEVLENQEEQQEGEDNADREIKIYGKVVGIIERNNNLQFQKFVCYLDPQSDNVMVPIDRSCPKMLILGRKKKSATKKNVAVVTLFGMTKRSVQTEKRDVEVEFFERHKKLFVVRYLEWLPKNPYPLGAAIEELEPGNTKEKGLHILKLIYGIKAECKPAAKQEMQQEFSEGWCIPDEVVQKRVDFRMTRTIFTVDPPGSTDLDDAVSCVCLPGQRYEVGVHISDVSYFIQKDSTMDKDSYKRGTTFYHPFPGDAYHMLPKEVVARFLSLLAGEDRLALSVIFTLDDHGQIVAEPVFMRSVIRSYQRLTYEEAEKLIVNSSDTPVEYRRVSEPIRCLHRLSRRRRMQRLRDGWMVYNADDDDGGALSHPYAHSLIEELMLMANNAVAEQVLARFPDCTPLRRQLAPSQDQVEAWKERHEKTARNSICLSELVDQNQNGATSGDQDKSFEDEEHDVLVAAEVWQMVRKICESHNVSQSHEEMISLILQDKNHPQHAVALSDSHDIMETAEYIDSTSQTKPEKRGHYSLQMRVYTHFTSPIRRYIDLVVHRMLVACIENSQCPYTAREMADITHHCNKQNAKSKCFDKATKELKLALKLKEAPLQVTTFVSGISDAALKLHVPYRSYISSRQTKLSFNLLNPSQKPDVGSSDVKVTWKCRMYDNSRKCPADSPASPRVTYPDQYFRIPEDKWQQILQSIRSRDANPEGFKKAIEMALVHAHPNGNPFSRTNSGGRPDGWPDKNENGVMSFYRTYQIGDLCRVQMHSQLEKGMLTPKMQLFNMTPHLVTCAEHHAHPIECFSSVASEIPGREKNITAYKSKWLHILSMTSCYSAVHADDTVILQNVKTTLEKSSDGIMGHFQLDSEFQDKNHLSICFKTKDDILRNNYDYLCINFTNLDVDTKPRLKIMEYDKRGHEQHVGPFNADDWKKQSFIIHCRIVIVQDCPKCKSTMKDSTKTLPVHFVVHQHSLPFPLVILGREVNVASTVEFISIPVPNRRMHKAVEAMEKASVLVRDIALQRPNRPDLFSDSTLRALKKGAQELTDLRVPEAGLNPLNHSQQAAVKKALQDTFSIIQGPPGTGKSVTGAYLAYFFTRLNQQLPKGQRRPQVLYCGPSNKSVDVVAGYLKQFEEISVVRIYSEQIEMKEYPIPGVLGLVSKWSKKEASMPEEMEDIALHHLIRMRGKKYAEQLAEWERRFRYNPNRITSSDITTYKSTLLHAAKEELQNHHIILCTCNAAGAFRISEFTRIIQVIVDEAGMCSEPETLIPLVSVRPNQVVLVGDHQQLRSIITEPNAKHLGMDISLLEKYKEKAKMLTIQYRMHERICEYPSKAFYQDKLETDKSVKKRGLDPIHSIWPNNGTTPRVFCHVNGREETLSIKTEEASEMSRSNSAEIGHVIRIVREMINRGASPEKIMVLSQYRLQCVQIEERLHNDRNPLLQQIQVSTVVKSQGSEWDYVVFSTVRSKPRIEIEEYPSKGWQRKHLGFIKDENQMNVALTRAKQGLIIIGNKHLLRCHNRWKEMLKLYEETHCLVDAQDFPARHR